MVKFQRGRFVRLRDGAWVLVTDITEFDTVAIGIKNESGDLRAFNFADVVEVQDE